MIHCENIQTRTPQPPQAAKRENQGTTKQTYKLTRITNKALHESPNPRPVEIPINHHAFPSAKQCPCTPSLVEPIKEFPSRGGMAPNAVVQFWGRARERSALKQNAFLAIHVIHRTELRSNDQSLAPVLRRRGRGEPIRHCCHVRSGGRSKF